VIRAAAVVGGRAGATILSGRSGSVFTASRLFAASAVGAPGVGGTRVLTASAFVTLGSGSLRVELPGALLDAVLDNADEDCDCCELPSSGGEDCATAPIESLPLASEDPLPNASRVFGLSIAKSPVL
jgi:hypothetical protein